MVRRSYATREPDFYTVGMKSYGRAPTFLLLTGYEQVRSVVAAIAGDWDTARNVELVLPDTGVCSTTSSDGAASCCTIDAVVSSSRRWRPALRCRPRRRWRAGTRKTRCANII
jgi:hypothetical protein